MTGYHSYSEHVAAAASDHDDNGTQSLMIQVLGYRLMKLSVVSQLHPLYFPHQHSSTAHLLRRICRSCALLLSVWGLIWNFHPILALCSPSFEYGLQWRRGEG